MRHHSELAGCPQLVLHSVYSISSSALETMSVRSPSKRILYLMAFLALPMPIIISSTSWLFLQDLVVSKMIWLNRPRYNSRALSHFCIAFFSVFSTFSLLPLLEEVSFLSFFAPGSYWVSRPRSLSGKCASPTYCSYASSVSFLIISRFMGLSSNQVFDLFRSCSPFQSWQDRAPSVVRTTEPTEISAK